MQANTNNDVAQTNKEKRAKKMSKRNVRDANAQLSVSTSRGSSRFKFRDVDEVSEELVLCFHRPSRRHILRC